MLCKHVKKWHGGGGQKNPTPTLTGLHGYLEYVPPLPKLFTAMLPAGLVKRSLRHVA